MILLAFNIDAKQLLADALYNLVQEKDFDSITISDICKRSGVSRATFYRYFHDKYELMSYHYESFVKSNFLDVESNLAWKEKLYQYANFYMQHKEYFTNILNYDGQNSFDEFLYSYSLAHFTRLAKKKYNCTTLSKEVVFAIKMYCYGNSMIVRDWLNGELDLTIDEFCTYRYETMPQIMKDFLD